MPARMVSPLSIQPEPESQEDEAIRLLVHQAIQGEEAAWRGLVDAYSRRVFAMARSRLHDDDLAEEITQSVFVTVATKLCQDGYNEQGRFEPWLFRITMNRVRDEFRRRARHARPTDPSHLQDIKVHHDILNQPVGTLLARHHRALKKLKALMEPAHPSTHGNDS